MVRACLCLPACVFVRSNTFHLADSDHMQITVERERDAHKYSSTRIHILLHTFALSHTHTHIRASVQHKHTHGVTLSSFKSVVLPDRSGSSRSWFNPSDSSLLFLPPFLYSHHSLEAGAVYLFQKNTSTDTKAHCPMPFMWKKKVSNCVKCHYRSVSQASDP